MLRDFTQEQEAFNIQRGNLGPMQSLLISRGRSKIPNQGITKLTEFKECCYGQILLAQRWYLRSWLVRSHRLVGGSMEQRRSSGPRFCCTSHLHQHNNHPKRVWSIIETRPSAAGITTLITDGIPMDSGWLGAKDNRIDKHLLVSLQTVLSAISSLQH